MSISENDRRFTDSPDVGHPCCLCSRCLKRIDEYQVPIRIWDDHGGEWRYHIECAPLDELSER